MNCTPFGGMIWALCGMCISRNLLNTYLLLSQLRKHLIETPYSAASSLLVLDLQFMLFEQVVRVFVAYFCTSYYSFFGDMAFEYDGFFIYHRVEVWFVCDPMLVWACITEGVWVYILFLSSCHYSLNHLCVNGF